MGASQQTQTQDQTTKRDPYSPALPNLNTILGDSAGIYSLGYGGSTYQGPRVGGLGGVSQTGLDYLRENAGAGLGSANAGDSYLRSLLTRGGSTPDQHAALAGLLNVDQADLSGLRQAAYGSTGYRPVSTAGMQQAVNGATRIGTVSTAGLESAAKRMASTNGLDDRVARSLVGGQYNLDGKGYAALDKGLAGPTQVQRSLQAAANGEYLDGANPYLDRIVSQGSQDAMNAVKGAFAASGRYGSGMFSNAAADAVSRNENNLRYADYDNERARQAQAAQAIDSGLLARTAARQGLLGAQNDVRSANAAQAYQGAQLGLASDAAALQGAQAVANQRTTNNQQQLAKFQTALQGAQAIANQGNQNNAAGLANYQAKLGGQQSLFNADLAGNAQRIGQYGTALQAAQGDRAAALAGLGSVSGLQAALLQPGRTQVGVGAAQDAARQQQVDAAMQKFQESQTNPWRRLGLLQTSTMPIASGFGTTNTQGTTTAQNDPGFVNSLLGGLMGAGGFAADLGKAAPGLISLFALSDERVKENIREIGETHDGQKIYSYNFVGDPTTQTGLLAQEVESKHPEAVATGPDGLKRVNYAAATEGAARKAETASRRKEAPHEKFAAEKEALADMIGQMLGEESVAAGEPSNVRSIFDHPALSSPFADPEHNAMLIADRQLRGGSRRRASRRA